MIQAHAGDDKDARSEALTAMVQTELFEAILNLEAAGESEMSPEERLSMLGNAAKNVAALTRSSVNVKKFQAEVEEATRKKVLEEQRAKLDALGNKGGVTAETQRAIREALGISS